MLTSVKEVKPIITPTPITTPTTTDSNTIAATEKKNLPKEINPDQPYNSIEGYVPENDTFYAQLQKQKELKEQQEQIKKEKKSKFKQQQQQLKEQEKVKQEQQEKIKQEKQQKMNKISKDELVEEEEEDEDDEDNEENKYNIVDEEDVFDENAFLNMDDDENQEGGEENINDNDAETKDDIRNAFLYMDDDEEPKKSIYQLNGYTKLLDSFMLWSTKNTVEYVLSGDTFQSASNNIPNQPIIKNSSKQDNFMTDKQMQIYAKLYKNAGIQVPELEKPIVSNKSISTTPKNSSEYFNTFNTEEYQRLRIFEEQFTRL